MLDAARIGRQTANGPETQLKRANTQRKNALAQHAWKPTDQPAWLTEKFYMTKIQPVLTAMSAIRHCSTDLGFALLRWTHSRGLPTEKRHWRALSKLAGFR